MNHAYKILLAIPSSVIALICACIDGGPNFEIWEQPTGLACLQSFYLQHRVLAHYCDAVHVMKIVTVAATVACLLTHTFKRARAESNVACCICAGDGTSFHFEHLCYTLQCSELYLS